MTAPNISQCVIFGHPNDMGSGFQYYIKPVVSHVTEVEHNASNSQDNETATVIGEDADDDDDRKEIPIDLNQPSLTENQEHTDETITTHGTVHKICYGTSEDFQEMFNTFWPFLMKFVSDYPKHDHTKQLQKWVDNGLKPETDLNTFKKIVGVDNLDQLFVVLRDSPAINAYFDIQWDHKIMYCMKPRHDIESSFTENTPAHKKYTVKACADHDIEFCILHKRIFQDIQQWSKLQRDPQDEKWMQWQKWLFAGLKPIQPCKEIRKIMEVTNINAYIEKVQPYPSFQDKYVLHDTDNHAIIKYSYFGMKGEYDYQTPIVESFEHFTSSFDINIHHMQTRLEDFQTRIEGYENIIQDQLNRQQKRFTDMMETQLKFFEQRMATTMEETIQRRTHKFDEDLQQHLDTSISDTVKQFETQLSDMTEGMLQDVYDAADDGHRTLKQAVEEYIQNIQTAAMADKGNQEPDSQPVSENHGHGYIRPINAVSPTPAKRFARVKINPNFRPSPNPYYIPDTTASLPGNLNRGAPMRSQPPMDNTSVPTTVHAPSQYGLPPVNHDQALKRARIQFTGLGDIFVFYNQLMNALEQFGIYLVPLSTVKYQQSLCPEHHRGHEVDA